MRLFFEPVCCRKHPLHTGMMALACLAIASTSLQASPVVLTDANSTAVVDPTSQAGMFHWDVQGQNQLNQQWFWFGLGNGPVQSLDTLTLSGLNLINNNEMVATYLDPGLFSISIDYVLTGGNVVAAGQHANADISETIKISNLSNTSLPLHFYQYSYFNLQGASMDTIQLGTNVRGKFNDAYQSNPNAGVSETVITPGADRGEVAPLGLTLSKLNSGGPVTLGPYMGPVGPGAVTWALEWDFNGGIVAGASPIISKDKGLDVLIVPEPATLSLLGLGLAAVVLRKRNRAE